MCAHPPASGRDQRPLAGYLYAAYRPLPWTVPRGARSPRMPEPSPGLRAVHKTGGIRMAGSECHTLRPCQVFNHMCSMRVDPRVDLNDCAPCCSGMGMRTSSWTSPTWITRAWLSSNSALKAAWSSFVALGTWRRRSWARSPGSSSILNLKTTDATQCPSQC